MKFWNKDKDVRRRCWIKVKGPDSYDIDRAKRWCQQQPSTGRFYVHYTNTGWWFEDQQDAVWFLLHWTR